MRTRPSELAPYIERTDVTAYEPSGFTKLLNKINSIACEKSQGDS
jgi:hypothetical protein